MPASNPLRRVHRPTPLAVRTARLLLLLHCAGKRGILVADLLDRAGVSRATLYRDLDRIRDAGWRIEVRQQGKRAVGHEACAVYSLAAWQRVPRLRQPSV